MLINFFHSLRDVGIPVTTRELLDLYEGLTPARGLWQRRRFLLFQSHLFGEGRKVL
jgi:uncharacterized protein with von Willebrand factor type A (vWA) domain